MTIDTAPRENFPVAVMRVRLTGPLLNALLCVTDALLSNSESHLDYSIALAGRISRGKQRQIPGRGAPWPFVEERRLIFDETEAMAYAYTELCARDASVARCWAAASLELGDMWCVSQLAEDYNPRHAHNGTLSGIFYLHVPPAVQALCNEDGCLAFVHSNPHLEQRRDSAASNLYDFIPREVQPSTQYPYPKRHVVRPQVGEGWIFPSWLLHEVSAFHGFGERRSVAFNLNVKNSSAAPLSRGLTSCQCERVDLFPCDSIESRKGSA